MNFNSPNLEKATLQKLWNNALIGLAIVDENGSFISANPNFCKIVEYTEGELQEMKFKDITHPDDVDATIKMSKRVADDTNDEDEFLMKKQYITKTGKIVWVILKVNRIETDEGHFAYFLSQVSELIEVQPPKVNRELEIPGSKQINNGLLWKWLRNYSGWLVIILGSVAYLIAKIIEYLETTP